MGLVLSVVFVAFASAGIAQAQDKPLSLDELYSRVNVADAALSPSGRYLALAVSREKSDMVVLMDLENPGPRVLTNIGHQAAGKNLDVTIVGIYWKTDDRLLFRTRILPAKDARFGRSSDNAILKMGSRLFAVNRDGSNLQRMLADNSEGALDGAFNLGRIGSFLLHDPKHVLLLVRGHDGPSLFRTDVDTGVGQIIEKPSPRTTAWWLDLDGNPVVRQEVVNGSVRYLRKDAQGKWKQFLSYRLREADEKPDYDDVGASDQPGRYYVLATPPGKDRRGVYLYDLEKESFGEPVIEHPRYDVYSARISRDGKRVLRYCYVAHVRICVFSDKQLNAHLKGVRKFFRETANVYVYDSSEDDKTMLLYVEGPSEPPSYYYYRVDTARIEPVGMEREAMANRAMPTGSMVTWKARDGLQLQGYLTRPPGAAAAKKLPLVVLPHGGPEARDALQFDPWVQYLAARGYAVFQPNFRGSEGFGKAFTRSGYGEWGGKMQNDITDGLDALVQQGEVDPARVCIVGASYGGYAALAGVSFTPDKYRCAVSIAGISDLPALIAWRRTGWSNDSESLRHLLEMLGDPEKDRARLAATSPAQFADAIRVPVLLIHGEEDRVVPISQSERMQKALEKAGRKTELMRLPFAMHPNWDDETERKVLTRIDGFLKENLGLETSMNESVTDGGMR